MVALIYLCFWKIYHCAVSRIKVNESYDHETGETNVYEDKYEYDEFGFLTNTLSKYPDRDDWVDPADYAG